MPYDVRLTDEAEEDLEGIGEYIAASDSPLRAGYVVVEIRGVIDSLAHFPGRGSRVQELMDVGEPGYREILFKPYRIIYGITDDVVYVHVIADGRRDMRSLLLRRLFRT